MIRYFETVLDAFDSLTDTHTHCVRLSPEKAVVAERGEVLETCAEKFGPVALYFVSRPRPGYEVDAYRKWYSSGRSFYFVHERDAVEFKLIFY